MIARAALVAVLALGVGVSHAWADRYEASFHVQPAGGLSQVGSPGTDQRVSVPSGGVSGRLTYGVRHWLAVEAELAGVALGTARFDDVPVTISGGSPMVTDVERSSRAGRLTLGATLRLGVAWIPTVSAGLGGQLRLDGDGVIAGSDVVPDGHAGGVSVDAVAFARVGLDRRINRRLVIGVSVGASHAFASPTIDTADVSVALGWYWYPLIGP